MKTQDFTGTRAGLSKRGRASAARLLASIVLDESDGPGAGAKVSRMCYNPPKFGRRNLSSKARPSGRGRRAINSGMEKNSVLRRLLVCALSALLTAAAGTLAAAPAAAQEKEPKAEEKPKKQEEQPKPAKSGKGNPTAEQVAETVVLVYGSRAMLQQIRRTGVE